MHAAMSFIQKMNLGEIKMELVYSYIKGYGDLLNNVEINYSQDYVAKIEDEKLIINKQTCPIHNYYMKPINNITMLLGKNGAGKTTLLEFLALNRADRIDEDKNILSSSGLPVSGFILYHLKDDFFAVDVIGSEKAFFSLKNLNLESAKEYVPYYKNHMNFVVKYTNGEIVYYRQLAERFCEDENLDLNYAYITSKSSTNRAKDNNRDTYTESYLFRRYYYYWEECGLEKIYRYLIEINDIDNKSKKKDIVFNITGHYELNYYLNLGKHGARLNSFEKRLREMIDGQCNEMVLNEKIKFKIDWLKRAIMYYFVSEIVNRLEPDSKEDELAPIDKLFKEIESINETGINWLEHVLMKVIHLVKIRNKDYEYSEGSKYISHEDEIIKEFLGILDELEIDNFVENAIVIDCGASSVDVNVCKLLHWYDKYDTWDITYPTYYKNTLNCHLTNMSDGERSIIGILGCIIEAYERLDKNATLVLVIDEPDRNLHPEMARKFINVLAEALNESISNDVQIVLSSHSPFMVTDILPENVYLMGQGGAVQQLENKECTFATNIYHILEESFMLESLFGEYSSNYLNDLVRRFQRGDVADEEKEELNKIIDKIGEPYIHNQLRDMYAERFYHSDGKLQIIEKLKQEKDETKLAKIKNILEEND